MVNKLCLSTLLGLVISGSAIAVPYSYTIDNFSITKNGSLLFNDPFNDGNPPPSAPNLSNGTAISYVMTGTMGPEDTGAPGRLSIKQSGAVVAASPTGVTEIFQHAMLATNQTTDLTLGLKNDDTFSVSGIFDLASLPSQEGDEVGIRLEDFGPSPEAGDDVLVLRIRIGASGDLLISFARFDFISHTINGIAADPFAPAVDDDQIELTLTRLATSSDAITASYRFIDGGTPGAATMFGPTADIFHGETYTRGGFYARRITVPEPATMALMGHGLVWLWFTHRRRPARPTARIVAGGASPSAAAA